MIEKKKPPTRAGLATPKAKSKVTPPKKAPAKTVAPVAEKPRNRLPHQVLISTTIQNAAAMQAWGKFAGDADLGELVKVLREEVKKVVQDGDMQPAEAMLYGQAMALQTIFTNLVRRAVVQERLPQYEAHMRLGLRAQAQCRATVEALAMVKNPMPYIRQANIANGPQQVNNGTNLAAGSQLTDQYAQAHTGAGENNFAPNKLLEVDYGQPGGRLDIGAAQAASRVNQALGAVG